jgi:GGDEF domain-containing protein
VKSLRDSIVFLLAFFSIVFGIAQMEGFETNVLNFQAAFFIMMAVATILGVLGPSRVKISIYSYLLLWTIFYVIIWAVYWRFLPHPRNLQELGIQFLLIEIGAGLSHVIGQNLSQVENLLEGLSSRTYPNRTLELAAARDRVSAELTRSRRYNRPLSVLVLEFNNEEHEDKKTQIVQKDLLRRFTFAKVGQILGDLARQTDLILDDKTEHFIIVCPETDYQAVSILASRIRSAVKEQLHAWVNWGTASFPNEALTFDDLLKTAHNHIHRSAMDEMSVSPDEVEPIAFEASIESKGD